MKNQQLNVSEKKIKRIITNLNVVFRINIILCIIFFDLIFLDVNGKGFIYSLCNWSDAAWNWMCTWYLFIFIIIPIVVLLLIISFCAFLCFYIWSYKILMNSKVSNLSVHNINWVRWWWLCPIINLYNPYQIMRDIYKNINIIIWRKFYKNLVLIRWISFLMPIFWIISFVLFLYIIYDIKKSYRIYYEKFLKNKINQ